MTLVAHPTSHKLLSSAAKGIRVWRGRDLLFTIYNYRIEIILQQSLRGALDLLATLWQYYVIGLQRVPSRKPGARAVAVISDSIIDRFACLVTNSIQRTNGQTDERHNGHFPLSVCLVSVCSSCLFTAANVKERIVTFFTLILQDVEINVRRWRRNCNFCQCNDNFPQLWTSRAITVWKEKGVILCGFEVTCSLLQNTALTTA